MKHQSHGPYENPASAASCIRWALANCSDPEAEDVTRILTVARARWHNKFRGDPKDLTITMIYQAKYGLRKRLGGKAVSLTPDLLAPWKADGAAPPPKEKKPAPLPPPVKEDQPRPGLDVRPVVAPEEEPELVLTSVADVLQSGWDFLQAAGGYDEARQIIDKIEEIEQALAQE